MWLLSTSRTGLRYFADPTRVKYAILSHVWSKDPEPKEHNGGHCDADPRTLEFVERLIDEEKPEFVVLSGDQVNGETAPDAQSVSRSTLITLIF